jgi:hypothetical protein
VKKRLNRRDFMRASAGTVMLGLPALDAFTPRSARADDAQQSKFAVIFHQANGVAQATIEEPTELFWPDRIGEITTESLQQSPDRATSELADYAARLLMLRGVNFPYTEGFGCTHVSGFCQLLTGAKPWEDPTNGLITAMGESLDNRLAALLNPEGREPLTLLAPTNAPMTPTLSFRGPKQPRSVDSNPWTVYKRITGLTSSDQRLSELVALRRKSVNDLVRGQIKGLLSRSELSAEDRRRLDLHLSSVRDIEIKLSCQLASFPAELDETALRDTRNLAKIAELHMDLIALTLACGNGNVATLTIGGCGNNGRLALPGFPQGVDLPNYHQISHRIYNDGRATDAISDAKRMHHEYDRFHARLFVYLLNKISAHTTPQGNLLDLGVTVWTNELGDGPGHGRKNVPWIIAGSAAGQLRQGVILDVAGATHNRLLNTLLTVLGGRTDSGDHAQIGDADLDGRLLDAALV